MGLDMYLTRDHYMPSSSEVKITVTRNGVPVDLKIDKVQSIIEEVGYWRKANAIHHWFVQNIQDGKDDCGNYYVTSDNLTDLMNLCQQVIDNPEKAQELLPTQSGFFFGDLIYDEWYFKSLQNTVDICKAALNSPESEYASFYYRSSW